MTEIIIKIDQSIIFWLKLHRTTPQDLVNHVQNDLPYFEITIDGINARLVTLCEEFKISSFEINGKVTWGIFGESTVTNKVWEIITSLAKNECLIKKIISTITKQNPQITTNQIINSIGILETNEIIHVNNKTVIVTDLEKSFIHRRDQN